MDQPDNDKLRQLAADLAQALHEANVRSEGLCVFCETRTVWRDGPVTEHAKDCEGEALLTRAREMGLPVYW